MIYLIIYLIGLILSIPIGIVLTTLTFAGGKKISLSSKIGLLLITFGSFPGLILTFLFSKL